MSRSITYLFLVAACGDNAPDPILTLDDLVLTTAEDTPLAIDVPITAVDVDAVALRVVMAPQHGTLAGTGPQWTYVPSANYAGADSVQIRGEDSYGAATATITIFVGAIDDVPVAHPDSFATGFDAVLTIAKSTVLRNDTDVDSVQLTVSGVTPGVHGTPASSGESIVFTPEAGFEGIATFDYTVSDGSMTATATVTVAIGADTAPLAIDDLATTGEDTELTLDDATLVANDEDVEHQTLAIIGVSNPIHGTVVHAGTHVTFVPEPQFHGIATFDYTITDGYKTDVGSVAVTVSAVNDAPIAAPVLANTDEDTVLDLSSATLTVNGTDLEGDALVVSAATATSSTHGTVTLANDIVTYTPDANFNGVASFSYAVSDGHGGTSSSTVTVVVAPVNDIPTAVADTLVTGEDTAIIVTNDQLAANDVDIDGDLVYVYAVAPTATTHGTVTRAGALITYTPEANYHGPADFTYGLRDGHGGIATGTVTVEVTAGNDAPIANRDPASTLEDTALALPVGDLLANDGDLDGDVPTVTSVASTANTHGTIVLVAGLAIYTPAQDFHGAADFTYTIDDGHGGTASALVEITVISVNDAPLASADASAAVEDTTKHIAAATLTANDTDVDGDTLTVTSVTATANTHGTVTLEAGIVAYTPAANYHGNADFTYAISDGHGGTASTLVAVTIASANDAPVAVDDNQTTLEDEAITFSASTLVANDTDADADTLTITTITATPATHGTVDLSAGTITYYPAANFNGVASFDYTISDGNSGTASARVTITITPVNDAPVANADTITVNEDAPKLIVAATLTTNDTDLDGDTLTVTAVTSTALTHGTVTLAEGMITYQPTVDYNGPAAFSYTISDGHFGTASAQVTFTVASVNDAPIANADSKTTLEDESLVFAGSTLVENDTDVDGDTLTVTSVTTTAATHGSVALDNGIVTYIPTGGYNGDASFAYAITDGTNVASGIVNVTITAVNDAPEITASIGVISYVENDFKVDLDSAIAVADSDSAELVGATIQITTGCTSSEDVLALQVSPVFGITVTDYVPATCTLTLGGVVPVSRYALVLRLATYVNTSEKPDTGTRVITFTVNDGATTGSATRDLVVTAVDDAPTATDDTASVTEDAIATVIDVLANDIDVDGGARSIDSVTQPANGTVAIGTGNTDLTYAPLLDFCSATPDVFTYTLTTGGTATVAVTVACEDDLATAVDDDETVSEGSTTSFSVLANDTDPDGGVNTIVSITQPTSGTATLSALGLSVTYTPLPGYCNEGPNVPRDTFTYTLTGSGTATVSVTVTCTCGLNKSTDFVVGSN